MTTLKGFASSHGLQVEKWEMGIERKGVDDFQGSRTACLFPLSLVVRALRNTPEGATWLLHAWEHVGEAGSPDSSILCPGNKKGGGGERSSWMLSWVLGEKKGGG